MVRIKRALVSVSNKRGVIDFTKGLTKLKVEIISTGGTAKALQEAKIPVTEVAKVTGFPEMLDGRVKTLHPKVHGGILAIRGKKDHLEQLEKAGIEPIDMVVVNLYPFRETIAKPDVSFAEAIENIDIGGPTMIRSAAKNHVSVAVVVDPARYDEILAEMKKNKGCISEKTLFELARDAFEHTAEYDEAIYHYLAGLDGGEVEFPPLLNLAFEKIQDLRYGENPHQKAAYYREIGALPHSLVYAQQLHGKELSYNNILDMDGAWNAVSEFQIPACVIVKHTNPCGAAVAKDIASAYEKAYNCDPVSAFGGIIAVNRVVDEKLAKKIMPIFYEIIIAPAYLEEALEILMTKKDLRIMYMGEKRDSNGHFKDLRRVGGGLLVQDQDIVHEDRDTMKVVSKKHPTEAEWEDLLFGWKVAKNVKSNAIIFTKGLQTIGIGAGQMSRIDSVKIAISKAGGKDKCKGACLASDAFFPFRDVVDEAAKVGIAAIIQPGGSIRDDEVIAGADEHKIALVFTGKRHFRH